jgi:hypothetical protein
MSKSSVRTAGSTGIIAALILALAHSADATVIRCDAGDVACLILAIDQANANGHPKNTIRLAPGTYTLLNVDNVTDGANGLPSITSKLTIDAPDTATLTRAATGPSFRLLHIGRGGNLTLRGVLVTNGSAEQGGGLFNNGGTLTIVDSAVSHNSGTTGGGLVNNGGVVTITRSTIANNLGFSAGAISNNGDLTIDRSLIRLNNGLSGPGLVTSSGVVRITASRFDQNFSSSGGPGPIWLRGGSMAIAYTSFESNFSDNGAAGIQVDAQASLTLTKSAFVGNHTPAQGAAIFNAGTVEISDTTFARNFGVLYGVAGTAVVITNAGRLSLINSTFADNRGASFVGFRYVAVGSRAGATTLMQNTIFGSVGDEMVQDCGGVVTSLGNNLFSQQPTGCTIILQRTDLVGDAGLAAFTDNGEPGNGHFPLLKTSPAINAGNDEACGETDQIGHERKRNRNRNRHCDIGAIEFKKSKAIDDGYNSIRMNEGDWPSVVARQE